MLMTICAVIFVLVASFALYCGGIYFSYLLWNNKYARKTRKEAIEALINVEKFLQRYKDNEV